MQFLDIQDKDFDKKFASILARGEETGREVEAVVKGIIADVRSRGDEALLDYTGRFDRLEADSVASLEVSEDEFNEAFARVKDEDIAALKLAVERVAMGVRDVRRAVRPSSARPAARRRHRI